MTMTWVTDAQFANNLTTDYLFVNRPIRNFLDGHDKFIIVSSKGMGKTLLMRHKRSRLERANTGAVLIPRGDMADYVDLPENTSYEFITAMRGAKFWEDLWRLSISISCLLNFPHEVADGEREHIEREIKRAKLPDHITRELQAAFTTGRYRAYYKPSQILNDLLQLGKSDVEQIRRSSIGIIHNLFVNQVSSACFVFIDSFDQAINRLGEIDLDIWCSAQSGLLRAAWELSRQNRHVKVYVTIRQEAFSSFANAERANMLGSILIIEYSLQDLRKIFEKAVAYYDKVKGMENFFGFKKIKNRALKIEEDPFEYLARHSLGVPRSLMILGEELSNSRDQFGLISDEEESNRQQRRVAEIVNEKSADDLMKQYLLGEKRLFFRGDDPEMLIGEIAKLTSTSVLSFSNIKMIAEEIVGKTNIATKHPFCLLHNLGLLGYVGPAPAGQESIQNFKKPYEFDWNYEEIIPKAMDSIFLIHPALHYEIKKRNARFNTMGIKIGDGYEWGEKEQGALDNSMVKIFVSYASTDREEVEAIVRKMIRCLHEKSKLHDIWLDQWKLKAGQWYQSQIDQALDDSEFLVLMVSKSSIKSQPVAYEWRKKYADKFSSDIDGILPFIVDDLPTDHLPKALSNIHAYQYGGDDAKIVRLVEDILFWKEAREDARPRGKRRAR